MQKYCKMLKKATCCLVPSLVERTTCFLPSFLLLPHSSKGTPFPLFIFIFLLCRWQPNITLLELTRYLRVKCSTLLISLLPLSISVLFVLVCPSLFSQLPHHLLFYFHCSVLSLRLN